MAEVEISRAGAVLEIALNRPAKKNALTTAMYRAIVGALEQAEQDAALRRRRLSRRWRRVFRRQ